MKTIIISQPGEASEKLNDSSLLTQFLTHIALLSGCLTPCKIVLQVSGIYIMQTTSLDNKATLLRYIQYILSLKTSFCIHLFHS